MTLSRSQAVAGVIALMIVWGSTFVVTKAAVVEIPPFTLAALRFAIATVVLVPIAVARGGVTRLPRPVPIVPLLLMALTGIALFTWASILRCYMARPRRARSSTRWCPRPLPSPRSSG